jgi:NADH-quinone oxidoreductase subunit N
MPPAPCGAEVGKLMTISDVYILLPFIILASTILVVMLAISFYRNHKLTVILSLVGLVLSFITLPMIIPGVPRQITPLVIMDDFAIYFSGLILLGTVGVVLLSFGYLEKYESNQEEYYLLILLSTLGSMVMVASNHFVSLFLGLEILSVSLYTLVSYPRLQKERIEAGIKYLILAGSTSAFMLFGIALIYAALGTLEFSAVPVAEPTLASYETILLGGWAMFIVGVGFKLALVPFQFWIPDVYQGSPAPVTAFIATISKAGVFAVLLRYFNVVELAEIPALWTGFVIIAIASMLYGNLVALVQSNLKRILAYSSIAHFGYMMVAFLAGGAVAQAAVAFYLAAYFITTLSAFGVITLLSHPSREMEALSEYEGLFWRRPWLALLLGAGLLSLAGIPPLAGLVAKIYVVVAGVEANLWALLIVLAAASVIGIYYYLRITIAIFRRPAVEAEELPVSALEMSWSGGITLALLGVLLVFLGVYPGPLLQIIERLLGAVI